MRVVLDTNVLVSALFWDGNERRVLLSCIRGTHELATSPFILNELHRVLRSKFDVPEEKVAAYVQQLLAIAHIVNPPQTLDIVREDPADNRILECALAAGAETIVTGDKQLLSLRSVGGVRIQRVADFSPR